MSLQLQEPEAAPDLNGLVDDVREAFFALQRADGHWIFEFEADATIPAEYIFLQHYQDDIDQDVERRIANYLRTIQADHGGWPLFPGGEFNISASVKAYYALKLAGDDPQAPHMVRARRAILDHGGAERANVFTRISLALFGQVPWRAVPVMPVEIMLLPEWFPFHLSKVSYWSRTVMVPLLILMTLKPRARNPRGIGIGELFRTPPHAVKEYNRNPTGGAVGEIFLGLDKALRKAEPMLPKSARRWALDKAMQFIKARLNGVDGLGGIFPAMANAVMAFDALGYDRDHPDFVIARRSVDNLLVLKDDWAYCQPCLSPIWDTCLGLHAVLEAGEDPGSPRIGRACQWLLDREITETVGDWAIRRPWAKPGGWAFQYRNDHYPDVDDTAVVVMALHRAGNPDYQPAIERATDWILAMQSSDGGWGAFEPENTHYHLNAIPFADHGALLDPPTVDVTARCLSMLAQLGYGRDHLAVARGLAYLRREQQADGSWFGRWGVNYVYGTWCALCAFNALGEDMAAPHISKAVDWLIGRQGADGGWGESCATYWPGKRDAVCASTPSQTAWAVLGLMAAGRIDHPAVGRAIAYLERAQRDGAQWAEELYTGVGFPRVFYLKYHGYSAYFPLWALARYRHLKQSKQRRTSWGM